MRKSLSAALLAAFALALVVRPAPAEPRSCTVFRAAAPPRLDGGLDDECWRAAQWQTGFTFVGGDELGAPFQTQFAMVWDDQCLYVAVRALEPEMDRLVARAPRGSNDLFRDDRIEIFLCAGNQRSNARRFVVNPLGCALDFTYVARKIDSRQVLPETPPWRCAFAQKNLGWEIALAIPLAELKIEPVEGATFAGNVARSRAVEQPEQYRTTWAPLARDFEEFDRFGAFRLAGLPPLEAAARSLAADQDRDRVTTVPGDRFTGRVLGLGEDGWLRMRCPEFPTEVRVRASAVDRIELPFASPPGKGARIALANGDFILGEVRSLGAERIVIANSVLGTLTLPTRSLPLDQNGSAAGPLLDTPFELGDLDPWMAVRGPWAIEKGRLVSPGGPQDGSVIAAILPQDGPITFEADVEPVGDAPLACEMVLFSSQSVGPGERAPAVARGELRNPKRGLTFNFRTNDKGAIAVRNWPTVGKGNWSQTVRFVSKDAPGLRLGFSYDPNDGAVSAAQDGQVQGPFTARDAPKDGRYVVFIALSPVAIRRLRVLPGIVAPGGGPEPAVEPPAPDGAVRVVTSEGRFTLRSCTLTAERLAGQSEILGALSIPRDHVRSIRFLRAAPVQ